MATPGSAPQRPVLIHLKAFILIRVHPCSSDFVSARLIEISKLSLENPGELYPLLAVYDSILIEVRDDVLEKWIPLIKAIMEKHDEYLTDKVPLKADGKVGKRYGAMKEIKDES